jgi:anaerobic magnesium-protoporphyrin IX monomethyl ester cyclase
MMRAPGHGLKISVIGHIVPTALRVELGDDAKRIKRYLSLFNFTRVLRDDNVAVDHLTYLKDQRDLPRDADFSCWDMSVCSALVLSSQLKKAGAEVQLNNYVDDDNMERVFDEIDAFDPDIIAFSTTFQLTQQQFIGVANKLRHRFPERFLIAGGHHVFITLRTMTDNEKGDYLLRSGCDAIVNDSQGEGALTELYHHFPNRLDRVANLIWRGADGSARINKLVAENNVMNDSVIDLSFVRRGGVAHLRTARSCAFKCAFCSYPSIAGDVATMDIDNVLAMLRQAKERELKAVFFTDDTFNVPKNRFSDLLDAIIANGLEMPWYSFLRCQYIDEDLVKRMKQSGCRGVYLGIESGSNKVLKNMKKGAVVDFYRRGIGWLRSEGIITVGSFVLGFPGEDRETMAATREFITNSGLDYYYIQPFYYLHHSPVYNRAKEFGLQGEGLFWQHNSMSSAEALQYVNEFFLTIDDPIFINPDYTLWEIAYLANMGLSHDEIREYRRTINAMTKDQMLKYGIGETAVTGRDGATLSAAAGATA